MTLWQVGIITIHYFSKNSFTISLRKLSPSVLPEMVGDSNSVYFWVFHARLCCKYWILSHLTYIDNAKIKQQCHSFESARKAHASRRQLPLQNNVSHGVRWCNMVSNLKDFTNTCKHIRNSPTIAQWRKVWRRWRLQTCFHHLLRVRIEIEQLQCGYLWFISIQLTSKRWIITKQFTARADLF